MRVLIVVLAVLLAIWPCAAKIPEVPRFRIVGPSEGLPSTMVVAISQDRAGYLWLGTLDGLVRYDGAGFRTWRHDPADPGSLPCNAVQALHIDALDRVWVGCGKTLSVLDAGRRRFVHYRAADYPLLKDGEIFSIAAFDGGIWAGTTTGALVRIDASGGMSSVNLGGIEGALDHAMVMNLAVTTSTACGSAPAMAWPITTASNCTASTSRTSRTGKRPSSVCSGPGTVCGWEANRDCMCCAPTVAGSRLPGQRCSAMAMNSGAQSQRRMANSGWAAGVGCGARAESVHRCPP